MDRDDYIFFDCDPRHVRDECVPDSFRSDSQAAVAYKAGVALIRCIEEWDRWLFELKGRSFLVTIVERKDDHTGIVSLRGKAGIRPDDRFDLKWLEGKRHQSAILLCGAGQGLLYEGLGDPLPAAGTTLTAVLRLDVERRTQLAWENHRIHLRTRFALNALRLPQWTVEAVLGSAVPEFCRGDEETIGETPFGNPCRRAPWWDTYDLSDAETRIRSLASWIQAASERLLRLEADPGNPFDLSLDALHTGPGTAHTKPVWNRETGELTYAGKLAKRIKNIGAKGKPTNVVKILDEFEGDGWPPKIIDPLTHPPDSMRLKNAVQSLNDRLAMMRFERDRTGTGIRWRRLA